MTAAVDAKRSVIRVVIAEDQASVRRGTALLLTMAHDMECVGLASDGDEAVKLVFLLHPDVVLMDLHMPVKGGVAAIREITFAQQSIPILVLTTVDDDETVFEAMRAGAQACLLKDVSEDQVLETIRALRRGESRLPPPIARKVMNLFRPLAPPTVAPLAAADPQRVAQCDPATAAPPTQSNAEDLDDKEERVLSLITEDASIRQVAQAMALAECTIKHYVRRIMEKLHANSRAEFALLRSQQRLEP